jgi:hypothetical protein
MSKLEGKLVSVDAKSGKNKRGDYTVYIVTVQTNKGDVKASTFEAGIIEPLNDAEGSKVEIQYEESADGKFKTIVGCSVIGGPESVVQGSITADEPPRNADVNWEDLVKQRATQMFTAYQILKDMFTGEGLTTENLKDMTVSIVIGLDKKDNMRIMNQYRK